MKTEENICPVCGKSISEEDKPEFFDEICLLVSAIPLIMGMYKDHKEHKKRNKQMKEL